MHDEMQAMRKGDAGRLPLHGAGQGLYRTGCCSGGQRGDGADGWEVV